MGERRRRDARWLRGGALAVSAGLIGCAGSTGADLATRTDSAGVEIVLSTAEDMPLPWEFEAQYTLGGEEEGPESFFRATVATVDADESGHLYVLDPASNRVVVFDPSGEFVTEFGRLGEGPGELARPSSISVSADGDVSIFDFGKGGLVRFGPRGEPRPQSTFPFFPWPGQHRHIGTAEDGMFVTSMIRSDVEGTFRHALQRVGEADTVLVVDHVFPRPEMVLYPACGGGLNLPRVFEVHVNWAPAPSGGVVLSRSAAYELERRDPSGALTRILRRDLPVRSATAPLAEEELGEGFRIDFGRGPCTIPPAEMVPERGFAAFVPWIDRVVVAPDGAVWVSRKEVGPDRHGPTDVFAPDGAYLGSLPASAPFPIVFLDADRFAAVETDEFDVDRLVVYRIARR